MTHSMLTSLRASGQFRRQPSRQPSKPLISARLSPVPEPSPSEVPESIIDHDEAIDLMPPGRQQGNPPDPNNSDSSSDDSCWGQPQGANLRNPVNLPPNPSSPLGTPPANLANLLNNPGTAPANIPANQANDLAWALTLLAGSIKAPCPAAPQCTKIWEPHLFNGSDPKKLQPFLVQLELNFRDQPDAFQLDSYKVNYTLFFLKGTALNYFEPSLMDPHANPAWSDDYDKLISKLQTNFGPFDIEANAENELKRLKMHDNQKVAKYIVSFQQLSSKVNWGDACRVHICIWTL